MGKSSSEKISEYRRKRKKELVLISGNKCNICGYNKVITALEFHHLIPEEKEYGLASKGTCHSLDKDLNELKKCILVCANCHREIHEGLFSIEELEKYKIYDEEQANLFLEENHKKRFKTIKYCCNCGKELSYDTEGEYCINCIGLLRRKVKDRPSREELKQLIRTKSFVEIGRLYQVSDNAIRKWCDAENLPRKKTEINSYSDEEWQKI